MYGERRPEFDPNQVLNNFSAAWKQFMSKLPGGGSGGASIGIILIAIVAGGLWLASGIYQVAPNEQATTQLFGKFQTVTEPGLRWFWPSPVGKVQKESTSENKTMELGFRSETTSGTSVSRLGAALMITGDLNIVDIRLAVQYKITDIKSFLFSVDDPGDPDRGNREGKPDGRTLRDATESAIRQVIGQRSIDDVLTGEKEQVQIDTQLLLQTVLDSYGTGISIQSVQLQEVFAPEEVRPAFDDVVAARQERETRVNQGEAYKQDRVPRAKGAAQTTIQAAEAFKTARVARAQGEADQFTAILTEYNKSKEVTRQRLFLEAMEDILPGVKLILIDETAGSGVLPFLPLTDNVPAVIGGGA
jgi:membrane protease subunit HflK